MRSSAWWVTCAAALAAGGCTSVLGDFSVGTEDAAAPDASAPDAGAPDAGPRDATVESGTLDARSEADTSADGPAPDAPSDAPAASGCDAGLTACAGNVCADLDSSPQHCGACGHSCNGASCTARLCAPYTIAKPPTTGSVAKLATDGAQVVWADTGNAAILQVPAVGGASTTLAGSSALYGSVGGELALANSTVAYVYTGGGTSLGGAPSVGLALEGQSKSGVGLIAGTNGIAGVAINKTASAVYYISENGTQWALEKCPVQGKTTTGNCTSPGFSGRYLTQLVADERYMLFDLTGSDTASGPGSAGLYVYDATTGASSQFSADTSAQSLAVDGMWAYWTDPSGTTFNLSRVPEAVPNTALQATAMGLATSAFAVDGTYVYYQSGSTIVSKPAAGGNTTALANTSGMVTQIAVSGSLLVWTDGSTISGLVLPPP